MRTGIKHSKHLKQGILVAVLVVVLLLGIGVWCLATRESSNPLDVLKGDDGKHIDLTLEKDAVSERYYEKKMADILKLENQRLGEPLTSLGASSVDDPEPNFCVFERPHPHGHAPGCEIIQTAHLNLDSPAAQQRFTQELAKLRVVAQQQGWEVMDTPQLDLKAKSGSFGYYKVTYYQEIDHVAQCVIDVRLDDRVQPLGVEVILDCTAGF